MGAGVPENVWVFWSGEGVLGVFAGVLGKVQVLWSGCWRSGYREGVLEWERVF